MKRIDASKQHLRADLWLVGLTVIWGTSFSFVKNALHDISPLYFLAIRFWLAVLILLPFIYPKRKQITLSRIKRGALIGLAMFFGMAFQTTGLKYTTASNSAFLTGTTVIIVPVLVVFLEKRLPRLKAVLGAILAFIGIYFMTNPRSIAMNRGDMLTLLCALSFAFEIVFIELYVKENEAFVLSFLLITATAIFASIAAPILNPFTIHITGNLIFNTLMVVIFSTAIAFFLQAYWQPKTTATAAAVIYTMEPLFAVTFAMLILGENLSLFGWIGAAFILCGMLITELRIFKSV